MSLLSFKGDLPENLGENREFKLHVYGKRQTSDSSWELFKTENEQIKTGQKILIDKKLGETTNLCVEIINSRQQIDVNMMLNLSITDKECKKSTSGWRSCRLENVFA